THWQVSKGSELLLGHRRNGKLRLMSAHDGFNVTRLVQHRPIGLKQRKLPLLVTDRRHEGCPFGCGTFDRELERVDTGKHGDGCEDEKNIDAADHAVPLTCGTLSP